MSKQAAKRRAADSTAVAQPAADIAVRLEGVAKRFGEVTALRAASLAIRRGELMTLLGPSGCGKTTLLNLIAGFFTPDEGAIVIDGERVNDIPIYRRATGIMFQSYALFPHMTVARNVGYGLRVRRLPKAEIARRVEEALALVKLTGLEDRRPRQLSGGQQQRVALARALVIRPKVLLLDEPFSALDKALRGAMQIEVRDIQQKLGLTTIFVTHDQSEALSLSDRIAVMSDGAIRQVGTPDEIYRRPADRFVASFVGHANMVSARIANPGTPQTTVSVGASRVAVPTAMVKGLAPGDAVDLLLRPEQLMVASGKDPVAITGTVAALAYQGGHVDLHVDAAEVSSSRLLIRLPGADVMTHYPVGSRIGLAIATFEAVAFPPAAAALSPSSSPGASLA
jgi:putative spermidine/putrescine transport system ATP-binding protein/spermidine/putrescine transport system ATP-binding protein